MGDAPNPPTSVGDREGGSLWLGLALVEGFLSTLGKAKPFG